MGLRSADELAKKMGYTPLSNNDALALTAVRIEKDRLYQEHRENSMEHMKMCESVVTVSFLCSFCFSTMAGFIEVINNRMVDAEAKHNLRKADKFKYARAIEEKNSAMKSLAKDLKSIARNLNIPLWGKLLPSYINDYSENCFSMISQKLLWDEVQDTYKKMWSNLHSKLQNIHNEKLAAMSMQERWGKKGEACRPLPYPSYLASAMMLAGFAYVAEKNVEQSEAVGQAIIRNSRCKNKPTQSGMVVSRKSLIKIRQSMKMLQQAMLGDWYSEMDKFADQQFYLLGGALSKLYGEHLSIINVCKKEATWCYWTWYVARLTYHKLRGDKVPQLVKDEMEYLLGYNTAWLNMMKDVSKLAKRCNLTDEQMKAEKWRGFNPEAVDEIREVLWDCIDDGEKFPFVMAVKDEFDKIIDRKRIVEGYTMLQP